MGYALVAYEKNIKRYFLITIVDGKEVSLKIKLTSIFFIVFIVFKKQYFTFNILIRKYRIKLATNHLTITLKNDIISV